MAETLRERLTKLVEDWEREAGAVVDDRDRALVNCATELRSALALSEPEGETRRIVHRRSCSDTCCDQDCDGRALTTQEEWDSHEHLYPARAAAPVVETRAEPHNSSNEEG